MAVTCDIQALLDANPCFGTLQPAELEAIKTQLLCNIIAKLTDGTPADCTTEVLLEDGRCYIQLYPFLVRVVQARLLAGLLALVDLPALDPCTASLSWWNLHLVQTQLLCTILTTLEGGDPVDCDLATLITDAKCFNTQDWFTLSRLQASLLCQINEAITVPPSPPVCTLTITSNPSDYTGDAGTNFSLSVVASGAVGTPTYQWQRDDGGGGWIDILDGEFDGTVASGSTTPTLTVTNAADFNTGSYRAIVTDPAVTSCTATSATATVTINALTGNHLLPGLLAYWRFEEASGPALDSSGNNHTLTEQGGLIDTGAGIVQQARVYSKDVQANFTNSSTAFENLTGLTIGAWGKFTLDPLGIDDSTLVAKGLYNGGTLSWWLILDHGVVDDLFTFYYTVNGSTLLSLTYTISGGIDENLFYFVCLRWDGATLRLSATPEDAGSVAAPNTQAFAGPFYATSDSLAVGGMPDSSIHYMDGTLDELGIWSRSLSDCEVAQLFTAKAGSFTFPSFDSNACV